MKRYFLGVALGILSFALSVNVVLALGTVTNFWGEVGGTSIVLHWVKAIDCSETLIRYRTDYYPTSTTDGTLVYSGTAYYYEHTGLTAGTVYYYSAWGKSGALYGAATYLLLATSARSQYEAGGALPTPALPGGFLATPTPTGLANFEPFYSIVNNCVNSWGVPQTSGWLGVWFLGITVMSLMVYLQFKSAWGGLAVSILLLLFGVRMGLNSGWYVVIPIVIGIGASGIARIFG